jgi:hypothetical protein
MARSRRPENVAPVFPTPRGTQANARGTGTNIIDLRYALLGHLGPKIVVHCLQPRCGA